ncbi:MAG: hypothetical protein ABFQ62_00310, partial [Patescibacteria group bacterium]
MTKILSKLQISKSFLIFLLLGIFSRFYNLTNRLYFVWDNGRDAWAIDKIVHGDLALIGHTSGIAGFFLGPAWFYLGSIGHILGKGNPWVISYWYILVTASSIPIFWLLSSSLFRDKSWQLLSSYLLLLIPASIHWSSFVWNPMITIPLMAGTYYCLLKARKSRVFLVTSFFLIALALQFEFAYAVFFIPPLFLLIPWIRKKINLKDLLYSAIAVSATLAPQILFELRNKFIMTKSLIAALTDKSKSLSWIDLWQSRPEALFTTTQNQIFGNSVIAKLSMMLVLIILGIGVFLLLSKKINKKNSYKWQISFILTLIPYFFFMLWRGNNGNFFDYYLTPHFVFVLPTLLLIIQYIVKEKILSFKKVNFGLAILGFLLITANLASIKHIKDTILFVDNQAGMKTMSIAIAQLYNWQDQDGINQGVFRIFTPNRETEHYDYLIHWQAK